MRYVLSMAVVALLTAAVNARAGHCEDELMKPSPERDFEELKLFLLANKYTSQFILMNVGSPGQVARLLADNRLVIQREGGAIEFVAFFSPSGVLHVQGKASPAAHSALALLLGSAKIQGINGPSRLVQDILKMDVSCALDRIYDDVVYALELESLPTADGGSNSRPLSAKDFESWYPFYMAYFAELQFYSSLSKDERQSKFEQETERGWHWGLFTEDGRLAAIASYNAVVGETAQVGGVYTPPEFRGQGFAKKVMERLIFDSAHFHGKKELILFTGDESTVAGRLYLRVGFKPKDRYTMAICR